MKPPMDTTQKRCMADRRSGAGIQARKAFGMNGRGPGVNGEGPGNVWGRSNFTAETFPIEMAPQCPLPPIMRGRYSPSNSTFPIHPWDLPRQVPIRARPSGPLPPGNAPLPPGNGPHPGRHPGLHVRQILCTFAGHTKLKPEWKSI